MKASPASKLARLRRIADKRYCRTPARDEAHRIDEAALRRWACEPRLLPLDAAQRERTLITEVLAREHADKPGLRVARAVGSPR